jgi:hypothetical protein
MLGRAARLVHRLPMGRLPRDKATEILLRRERAEKSRFAIFNIGDDAVFSSFQIESDSGRMYTVHIHDTLLLRNTCSCDDYQRSALGTCKHIEAVLLHLAAEVGCEIWQPDQVADVSVDKRPVGAGPVLFFDLETRRAFDEVGGRRYADKLGVSIAVTQREDSGEFAVYEEEQCPQLVDGLLAARLVVGFAIVDFDYRVLDPWAKGRLATVPTIDICDEATSALGHRVSLDRIASATLGETKSSHGMQAIEWWRAGRVDLITEYCKRDVELVGLLYQYGKETGHLVADTRDHGRLEFPISWIPSR